jgi:hypothetical protein
MRAPRGLGCLAVAVLAAALCACTSSGQGSRSASAAATPHATANVQDVPVVGTCWDVPPEEALVATYWNDDSSPVPCTASHTTETVFAEHVDQVDPEGAIASFGRFCALKASEYVGAGRQWVPVHAALYLPSDAQMASGQSWVRCDVGLATGPRTSEARVLASSLANAATSQRATVWACLDSLEGWEQARWVSCAEPHAYETSGRLLVVENADPRPGAARLAVAAAVCDKDVRKSLVAEAVWEPEPIDDILNGSCWVHRADGRKLPPLE